MNGVARRWPLQLDLPGVLRAARESCKGLAPANRATLSLLTEDGQSMEIAAVEGVGLASPGLSQKGSSHLGMISSRNRSSAASGW